ncbi:MAG: hypothetical protein ACLPND_18485 [Candidatus Korobacteraceae bacterium]|jgi:hypothetical protein
MRTVLISALSLAMLCAGCSTAWLSTVDSILAAAAPALVNILQIAAVADGQPVNGDLTAKINADALAIKTLAADFARASSGAAPGVCQQLQSAVSDYQADQALVLQVAQVKDPNTQAKITILSDLVAGTVQAVVAVIPSCQNAAVSPKMRVTNYRFATFAAEYNSALVAKTGNAAVDAVTPRLRLHEHSSFVRWATFGRLQ